MPGRPTPHASCPSAERRTYSSEYLKIGSPLLGTRACLFLMLHATRSRWLQKKKTTAAAYLQGALRPRACLHARMRDSQHV